MMNFMSTTTRQYHHNFNSPEKIENVVDFCENLGVVYHQQDVAEHFDCAVKTLYNHTQDKVIWPMPGLSNARITDRVCQQRMDYSNELLDARTGRIKKRFGRIAMIDHSWFSYYGGNRAHLRQARRKRGGRKITPKYRSLSNPKVHCMVLVHLRGVKLFRHATKRKKKKKRRSGNIYENFVIKNRKINAKEWIRGARAIVVGECKKYNIKTVIMDCVKVNHCKAVVKFLKQNGINVYPSSGHGHRVKGGYPTYSPQLSWLDENILPVVKIDIHKKLRNVATNRNKKVVLYNMLPKFIEKNKYANIAKKAVKNYPTILKHVIDTNGRF